MATSYTAPESLPVSELREHLAEIMRDTERTGARTYITHRGRRVAAIVPVDEAERLEAAEDAYLVKLANEAKAAGGGVTTPFADVLAELAAEDKAA